MNCWKRLTLRLEESRKIERGSDRMSDVHKDKSTLPSLSTRKTLSPNPNQTAPDKGRSVSAALERARRIHERGSA